MSIHGKGLNYLWDGSVVETWNSTGNNSAKVTLYNAAGTAIAAATPLHVSRGYFISLGSAASPDPGDWESDSATAPVSGDYDIRDTNDHFIAVPAAATGWRVGVIGIRCSPAFDQLIAMTVTGVQGTTANKAVYDSTLLDITLPASGVSFAISSGAGGQGSTAGGATAAANVTYAVPALVDPWRYILMQFTAAGIPTAGSLNIITTRVAL